METPWLVGLDLGQVADPTALAIIKRQTVTFGARQRQEYQCPHLERFPLGTPYPLIVEAVAKRLADLPRPRGSSPTATVLGQQWPLYHLIIDYTGVGRPVADMFDAIAVWPIKVTMTHGFTVTQPTRNEFHVPKPTLVGSLQVVIQDRRFEVARSLTDAQTLIKEAHNFQYKLSAKTGDDQYGAWREGTHDDLLFAVALTVWYGEHYKPLSLPLGQETQTHATGIGNPLQGGR